jgi:hypothetical protein
LWEVVAAIAITPESEEDEIFFGTRLSVIVPSPNWPLAFDPQAQTVPSLFKARLWSAPAVMARFVEYGVAGDLELPPQPVRAKTKIKIKTSPKLPYFFILIQTPFVTLSNYLCVLRQPLCS